jgi:leader peptidase (prepilin peptidase)/N-methyltransferase
MNYLIVFVIGILTGSFLNICISRIPQKESIALHPSHCAACGRELTAADLIPVLSYMFLGGKCRYCKAPISVQYPFTELLSGILFLLLFCKYNLSLLFVKYTIITCILIVIAVIDFNTREIPDGLLILGIITAVIFISVDSSITIGNAIIGFAAGFCIFLAIAIASNAMGGGDIKLMAFLGLAVGWRNILLVSLFSFIIGSVISLLLIIFKIKGRKDYIPFAPFILSAYIIIAVSYTHLTLPTTPYV